jgi:hypothetical protein
MAMIAQTPRVTSLAHSFWSTTCNGQIAYYRQAGFEFGETVGWFLCDRQVEWA